MYITSHVVVCDVNKNILSFFLSFFFSFFFSFFHSSHDIPLAGGVGEAGEGSGGGQVDAGGSQASARRRGEVSHSVWDPDPQDPHVFGQCYGSGMFIPDPGSYFLSIPDPNFFPSRIRIKEFKYFNQKNGF
jgi:hypothetical protein